MLSLLRFSGICLLALTSCVWAVTQPSLGSEARDHYDDSHQFIRSNYPQGEWPHPSSRVEYYSHLLSGHSDAEREAWSLSQTHGYGPAYVSWGHRNRNAYVTTRIPHDSQLGRTWGFSAPMIDGEGNRQYKDIYAFWHVNNDRVKLMRLDAWKAGGQAPQILTWRNILGQIH